MKSRYLLSTTGVAVTLLLASCGGSKSAPTTEATTTTVAATTTEAPATTAAPSTTLAEAIAPTSTPANTIADIPSEHPAITTTWETFFNKDTPVADRQALLEDGDQLTAALDAAVQNPMIKQITVAVTSIAFEDENTALITYDVLMGGAPLLRNSPGVAVKVNNEWKVSKKSFCGLAALAVGGSVEGCA